MYLSRLALNPRHRQVQRDLADCHALHRRVLAAFPATNPGADARAYFGVLYRLDIDPRSGIPILLVQSRIEPNWQISIADSSLLALDGDQENPACKSVAAAFAALTDGTVLRFRLRANPTRRLATPPGKRVDLRRESDQIAWLHRKGEQSGFALPPLAANADVPDLSVVPEGIRSGRRVRTDGASSNAGAGQMSFGSVVYEGRLQIVEADRFRQALGAGIGSGKAFGFGLLSVAPDRG
jgi:CRISPR system Cascade subunit CasE